MAAVALTLAYPLRAYLKQETQEQHAVAEQHRLKDEIADLKARQAALKDPAYIKAEAKRRLQYVSPGDTVYVVKVPKADIDRAGTADGDERGTTGDGGLDSSAGGKAGDFAQSRPRADTATGPGTDTETGPGTDTATGSVSGSGSPSGTAPAGAGAQSRTHTPPGTGHQSGKDADRSWYSTLWGTLTGDGS
jgi:cell division protein FtsL